VLQWRVATASLVDGKGRKRRHIPRKCWLPSLVFVTILPDLE
jgi:hypothetical protein